jgi:L-seryl-tRNA(Ser) seleniumtransferase
VDDVGTLLAGLPKTDRVLDAPVLVALPLRRELTRRAVQGVLDDLRRGIRAGKTSQVPDAAGVADMARARLDAWLEPHPRAVINATGVLLHTNVGRAPLDAKAVEAMTGAAGYCDLEVEMDSGRRGSRFDHIRPFATALLGTEDVHVVNNNAAGLLLSCTALGQPGGVVVAQGQMVEIGDGFRVATMAAAGGCRVWPVGSANRTHLGDYEAALDGTMPGMQGQGVSALLWVHLSNFRKEGFVHEVGLPELAALAKRRKVPLVADLGSGSLGAPLPGNEPSIQGYLDLGADLVLASGDKLLGGPQAGVIAGAGDLVQRCRKHPMARALRPDKTSLAALHATLVAHAREGSPPLPFYEMAGYTVDELRGRAQAIVRALGWPEESVRDIDATIGGGSLPGDTLPSVAVALPTDHPNRDARRLRLGDPPIVGRIVDDALLLDLRTVPPADDERIIAVLRALRTS